jgi:hypothetical protein
VVPFFFYPKFEHAGMCSVPIYKLEMRAGQSSRPPPFRRRKRRRRITIAGAK